MDSHSSTIPLTNYPRRVGSDDSGRDYEIRITALLSLRCMAMKDTKDMWLGSNVDQVGDFDDIVLYSQSSNGNSTAYMIQLKHQEIPKNITQSDFLIAAKKSAVKRKKWKEDFSLSKYCTGYLNFKNTIDNPTENESEILQHLRRVNKIVFVLFTNKGVNKCDFLSNVHDVTNLEFLNTNDNIKESVYNFDDNHSKLNYDKDFLKQLVLFTNQSHAKDVDKLIKKEIKKLLGVSKNYIDYKEVTNKFLAFIKIWIKETEIGIEDKDTKMHLTLTKEDVFNKLSDIVLEPYNINLAKDLLTPCDSLQTLIWNESLIDKTITIVDSDEAVSVFLKQCIGNNVGIYSNGKTWNDELSKKAQDLFYKEHNQLKSQMLKLVGNNRNITMFDIYKCLWFNNKLPLLLEIDDEEHFKIIRKVLKLFQYSLKVIIINKSQKCLLNITDVPSHFATLKHLKNEDRVKVLNFSVSLQGRSSVSLGSLIDKAMYEYIKCKDIIHILLGDFNIGNVYKPLNDCYVNRSISKVILNIKMLKQVQDIFVIHKTGGKIGFNDILNGEHIDLSSKDNIILTEDNNFKLEFGEEPAHRLSYYYKDYLEWNESSGCTEKIRQHQIIEPKNLNEYLIINKDWKFPQDIDDFWFDLNNLLKSDFLKTTRIINACPGMGKSMLLNFIALKAPPNMWVIKVNLNEHYDYYEKFRRNSNLKSSDHINYFNDIVFKKYGCNNIKLTKAVFEKLFSLNRILILLDGFDEISISYKDEVTEIAKILHNEGFAVWLTTRPVMKQHLEEKFDIISNTLKPFCLDDQKNYLIKYLSMINPEQNNLETLKEFAHKLLEAARINLKDRGCGFTGIPLQLKLLADVFKNECTLSLSTGIIHFNDKFDLLYLYEKFMNDKNDILCSKFGIGVKEMRIFFENHQQLFALKTLFHKDDLSDLNLDQQLTEYYEDKQHKIQFLQREGVIVVEQNKTGVIEKFNVNFVHRTFAEYLAARWLSENFNSKNDTIRESVAYLLKDRFHQMHGFLFIVFDLLIARNCPLHLAVINGQIEEATKIIKFNPRAISKFDEAGRTALHVIAQYGVHHPQFHVKKWCVQDDMVNLIENIPSDKITDNKDSLLDYGPLDYAIHSRSFAVANKLCEKSQNLDLHIFIDDKDKLFEYCDYFEYKYLFKLLLPYFVSRDLLLKQVDSDTTLESYCTLETDTCNNKNIHEYAKERGVTTLIEMFQSKANYYNHLQFAAAFGTEDNVLSLLSQGVDVNEDDVHYNMPLHYAAIHGRLEIVNLLLSKGAELEEPGETGNRPIHYAAENGHGEIVKELLSRGADIDQLNNEGDTPLLLALMNNKIDTAKMLLLNGAVGDVKNDLEDSALNCAAENGYGEILTELVKNDSCNTVINIRCNMNQTLLHRALSAPWTYDSMDLENQKSIVHLLLDKGVDVNSQDENGNTALHASSKYNVKHPKSNDNLKEFFEEMVLLLLNKGADVNIKNIDGETALTLAIKGQNTNTVAVLETFKCVSN